MEVWVFVLTVWLLMLSVFCLIQRGRIDAVMACVNHILGRIRGDSVDEPWRESLDENDYKW